MTPRKKPEDFLKLGRPSLYKPEYCAKVVELGREGCSPAQIASHFDVDRVTLRNWADEFPDFFTAMTRAKVHEQAWWEMMGQKGLVADRFNAQVWSKSVAARFREDYTERKEVTGADGGAIKQEVTTTNKLDISSLDDDELDVLEKVLRATQAKQAAKP